jgi:dTDP-4-dehydrorhamnose 3,5-epimerase
MKFEDVIIYEADMFTDFRGDIFTTYKKKTFEPQLDFIHDKYSTSRKDVLRGIHGDHKTWKLVSCLYGELYFVVVDNRPDSPTYLEWDWMILSDRDRKQVLLPPGFGNGFYVMSENAIFSYKLSYPDNYADVNEQFTLKWNDDRIKIEWPTNNPILQKRDR